MSTLRDEMQSALKYAGSVQKAVRSLITERTERGLEKATIGHEIADEVAAFKATNYPHPDKDHEKRVNNIINDVSRICRDLLGYSIVCTKRSKGKFEYHPVIPTPRATPAKAAPHGDCPLTHFDDKEHCIKPIGPETLVGLGIELGIITVFPESSFRIMLNACLEHMNITEAAKILMDVKKERGL